ncbi:MAG: hypothetical protein U5J64_07765 [Halobacteriales archaeon]|nr:hypothetical protein [Halobacteriales archaeon]
MEYFDYSVPDEPFQTDTPDSWNDIERLLQKSQTGERQRLEKKLQEIDRHLEKRRSIHGDIINDLDHRIEEYEEELRVQKRQFHGPTETDRLEELLSELKEKRQERRLEHWRDIQELEQERRQLLFELEELEDAENLISYLL